MRELIKTNAARRAVAEAKSVDELKNIRNQAEALRYAAIQAGLGLEIINDAAEIKLRAERRAGEMLAEMEKRHGARDGKTELQHVTPLSLNDVGITKGESHRWQAIAAVPQAVFDEQIEIVKEAGERLTTAGMVQLAKEKRRGENAIRISKLAARPTAPLENGKRYHVIYADPPWQYEHPISESRRIENQYPTMSLDDIVALPVSNIAADDSILFLWVTTPMARKGFTVMEAWGFEYRTGMVWVKPSIGMGHWVRQRHELIYIGTRGSIPTPAPENKPDSVLEAPRLDHSQKPEEMYNIIESMLPGLLRVELFARDKRPGWDSWGNQV
jgi:N6-adenosine-specific RNA methylase IME4